REAVLTIAIMNENGMRNHRSRREAIPRLNHGFNTVFGQNLESRPLGRTGQRVRVFAHEQRAINPLALAVIRDGLRDRENVGLVEAALRGSSAVAARAEA